jgi:hypothetical protein
MSGSIRGLLNAGWILSELWEVKLGFYLQRLQILPWPLSGQMLIAHSMKKGL